MAEPDVASSSGADAMDESPAQKAARLRREKRNAKLVAGGSERLNRITSLGGRPVAAENGRSASNKAENSSDDMQDTTASRPAAAQSSVPSPTPKPATVHDGTNDDPAEVDISQMFQRQPPSANGQDPQALFRQMLMASGAQDQGAPGAAGGQAPGSEDPMMQMMQQLLGGAGGGADGSSGGGLPPGLANMFGGQQQSEPDTYANNIWRIVHAAFSLLLGLYAAVNFTFTGSKAARSQYAVEGVASQLFWIFATIELLLQSSRYFIDGGKLPVSGIMGGLGQMLPEPYANYVRIFSRYSIIYTTVVSDAMVVIFVLGCVAWWKGLAAA